LQRSDAVDSQLEKALAETRKPSELTPEERELAVFRIKRARTRLITFYPFFGFTLTSIMSNVVWVGDDNLMPDGRKLNTLATDGRNLYVYAPFVIHIESDEIMIGIILHELFHVILEHVQRSQGHNPYLANIAMDYAVNLWVNDTARSLAGDSLSNPFGERPDYRHLPWYIPVDFGFYSDEFRRPNGDPMTWEEIYDILLSRQPPETFQTLIAMQEPQPGENGTASGLCGTGKNQRLIDHHGTWRMRPAGIEGEIDTRPLTKQDITDAMAQGKAVQEQTDTWGKLPGSLRRMIERWISPPLPWTRLLQNYLTYRPADYGWAPGDTRFPDPMPWPTDEITLEDIVIVIDTSGSMDDKEVASAIAQCEHIARPYRNIRLWIMMCDADVHTFQRVGQTIPRLERHGYGGTSFIPPFRFLHALARPAASDAARYQLDAGGLKPRLVIYFTDGYGDFPDPERPDHHVDCDVLWVITNDSVTPPKHRRYLVTRLDVAKSRR
jgi:predicted metal-dependent peptidase